MTPAERLLAAADLLDKRAEKATDGPWTARVFDFDADSHDFADVIGKQEVEQYSGSYTVKTALVAGGASEVGEPGWLAPANANYIATMHPEVGKALAKVLREEARRVSLGFGWTQEALALADLLLAGAS